MKGPLLNIYSCHYKKLIFFHEQLNKLYELKYINSHFHMIFFMFFCERICLICCWFIISIFIDGEMIYAILRYGMIYVLVFCENFFYLLYCHLINAMNVILDFGHFCEVKVVIQYPMKLLSKNYSYSSCNWIIPESNSFSSLN